jgi:hypothetical protein
MSAKQAACNQSRRFMIYVHSKVGRCGAGNEDNKISDSSRACGAPACWAVRRRRSETFTGRRPSHSAWSRRRHHAAQGRTAKAPGSPGGRSRSDLLFNSSAPSRRRPLPACSEYPTHPPIDAPTHPRTPPLRCPPPPS